MAEYVCTFEENESFDCTLHSESFAVDFGVEIPVANYQGSYSVTPSADAQVLPTQNKLLGANITIAPIPQNYGRIEWNGSDITVS